MSRWILVPAFFLLSSCISGCVSSVVVLDAKLDTKAKPNFEDYFDGYLFGWLGAEEKIDLAKVCMDQKPYGFQRTFTGEDGFFWFITFGIYTPSTVRVWCGNE